MKKIPLIFICVSAMACQNQKARLVDLQKHCLDSAAIYRAKRDSAASAYAKGTWSLAQEESIEGPMISKMELFKNMADSCEWELKKY